MGMIPFAYMQDQFVWPYQAEETLIVPSGETVNLTTDLLQYKYIEIQPEGFLNITSSGILTIAAKDGIVVEGLLRVTTTTISKLTTTLFDETISHSLIQSLGGSGGRGTAYGSFVGGIGGLGTEGYGGGGGGGLGGALLGNGMMQSQGGSGGQNGAPAYHDTSGVISQGGQGMSTLGLGGKGSSGYLGNASGGSGGGSGGGAGKMGGFTHSTGGGGGGNKGLHGGSLIIYSLGSISGSGTISCDGFPGFDGGNGGDMLTGTSNSLGIFYGGTNGGSGGGGGGGAGGSGGNLYLRSSFVSENISLSCLGGVGGYRGRAGLVLPNSSGVYIWPKGQDGEHGQNGIDGILDIKNINLYK
jgi:hypothetical protein